MSDQLKQRNRELSILNAIAHALNQSVNLDQALETALEKVAELLGLSTGWIWLMHEDTHQPYLAAAFMSAKSWANSAQAIAQKPLQLRCRED